MINISRFKKSLQYAWHGLRQAAATENSFRIHLLFAAAAILLAMFLKITPTETAIIIVMVTIVLTLELVNTVVERFVGILEPRVHSYVKIIKDIMAAAVLLNAMAAVIVGFIIFLPYILRK